MATRWTIQVEDKRIYGHYDGYIKDGVGQNLFNHLNNPEEVELLMNRYSKGNYSHIKCCIDPNLIQKEDKKNIIINDKIAFQCEINTDGNESEFCENTKNQYNYIWNGKSWLVEVWVMPDDLEWERRQEEKKSENHKERSKTYNDFVTVPLDVFFKEENLNKNEEKIVIEYKEKQAKLKANRKRAQTIG
ncbi:MAG: hypothetical protein ACRC4M_02020 [Mycoplasma sp.]